MKIIVGLLVLMLLVVGCAGITAPQKFSRVFQDQENKVRMTIYDGVPCKGIVANLITTLVNVAYREGWQEARGIFTMKNTATRKTEIRYYNGCWRIHPSASRILLVFEDMDHYEINSQYFRELKEGEELPQIGNQEV